MSDARITQRRPGTETPAATGSAGTGAEDPTTLGPSGVFTAPPSTVGTASPGPAGAAPARPFERVMEATPPLPDVMAETAAPARSRRWQGLAAGVLAAAVLAVLAWLALVPWLRTRAPAGEPAAAAAATPTPIAAPTPAPTPAPTATQPPTSTAPATSAGTVEVRRGDTLWHLSASHLGDPLRWPELHRANRATVRDPDLIYPGQELRIPR